MEVQIKPAVKYFSSILQNLPSFYLISCSIWQLGIFFEEFICIVGYLQKNSGFDVSFGRYHKLCWYIYMALSDVKKQLSPNPSYYVKALSKLYPYSNCYL